MGGNIVRWLVTACCIGGVVGTPLTSAAQTIAAGSRAETGPTSTVTVDVDRVPLKVVLQGIAQQASLSPFFGALVEDNPTRVTLHVRDIPVTEAFQRVLVGTGIRATIASGRVVFERDGITVTGGQITGTVTNAKTHQPLRGATVALDDSVKLIRSNDAGQYRFANVPAGSHRIVVRLVGFVRQTKPVTVNDDQSATLDFALESSVNTLDQVVVTATGEQRYRELGHVVTVVHADSLVREAPITSLSELLTARVPGLQVMGTSGGAVGGEVALRLRGTTTTSLDPQPIVVVDGVRYKNTNTINGNEDLRPNGAEPRSPLNDLNVNDIETVEVVKGPSASTLYGPDAANGVIVITTKHGKPGKPQWHVYAYPDLSTMSVGSKGSVFDRPVYQGWGHIPGTNTVYQGQCQIRQQAAHQCVLDSLVALPNAVDDPQLSVVAKQRPQWHSGASVSGATGGLAYFFSGNFDSETGALRLSPIAQQTLEQNMGVDELSKDLKTPNTQQSLSLRTNLSTDLSPTTTISLTGNYVQANQRGVSPTVFNSQFGLSPFTPGQTYSSADSLALLSQNSDYTLGVSSSTMDVDRLTATFTGSIRPRPWFGANASIGMDLDNTIDRGFVPGDALCDGCSNNAYDQRRNNTNRNVNLGSTATAHTGIWSFRTSLGVDYAYSNTDALNTTGNQLAPGSSDISTASTKGFNRQWTEMAELGGYAEEVIGVRDRLFITASTRLDGSTTFGDAYVPRPYPKAGLSWILSEEPFMKMLRSHGLNELRLRYSYGAASRYPTSMMKNGQILAVNAAVENNTGIATFSRNIGANPDLRPERSRESEYGADATIGFLQIGLTWYQRRTDDELQDIIGPNGTLAGWQNVGDLEAHGFEATVTAKAFQTQNTSLDLNFQYSYSTNKVLSLGGNTGLKWAYGGYAVGYPLGASFYTRTIGYVDSAGGQPDGYISQASEVISSPTEYLGTVMAPTTYSMTPVLSVLGGRIHVSTMIDGQSGGVMFNLQGTCFLNSLTCPSNFLKDTPLFIQAVNFGVNEFGDAVQSSDFVRWREFDITGELPWSIRRLLHLSRATASFQLRNLALWSRSRSVDPESVPGLGVDPFFSSSTQGAIGLPQPRAWTIRFDVAP